MLSDVVDSRRQSSVNSALCRAGFVYDAGSSQIQLRPETERPFRAGPKEGEKKRITRADFLPLVLVKNGGLTSLKKKTKRNVKTEVWGSLLAFFFSLTK